MTNFADVIEGGQKDDDMTKNYKTPPVVWLKMTDFTHGWLQHELGGAVRIKEQKVLSIQHIKDARKLLKMETVEDMMERKPAGNALSATRKNCMEAGLLIDPETMEKEYGITKDTLKNYVPIECPRMCLTRNGVIRPWSMDVCFSHEQASAIQKMLRTEFWKAVEIYDVQYSKRMDGRRYPAKDMIEDFCADTDTPDLYAEAIRREWQRRVKRSASKAGA